MFTLEDREICKNCDYKEICAGECEKTINGYDENHIPVIDYGMIKVKVGE